MKTNLQIIIAGLIFIFSIPSPALAAPYFIDNFHRPDSNNTGNGWIDSQVGGGSTWGISNSRSITTGNGGGTPWSYRTDIIQTSGIAIKGEFSSANFSDGYYRVGILASVGSDSGYNIALGGSSNRLELTNNGTLVETSPFTFNNNDHFAYEWDITPAPQNWTYLYVWDTTTGSKPNLPSLSWTNGGGNFIPSSTGNQIYFLNGLQGTNGVETMYTYLFQIDPYSPVPPIDNVTPSILSLSISSNNASSTLARFGDIVTLKFITNKPVKMPVVKIEDRMAIVKAGKANSFTASTLMLPLDPEGPVSFSVTLTDLAGNKSSKITSTIDGSSVFHYHRLSKRICTLPLPKILKTLFCS